MSAPRSPAVAGRFYPGDAATLERDVRRYLDLAVRPEPAFAVVAPHAGYVYSGAIAAQAYARVVVPPLAVVFCPNHTGMGTRLSLWPGGAWSLPGGEVPVDDGLVQRLRDEAGLELDALAHLREHSAEVQLPFLRARNPEVRIAVVCVAGLTGAECVRVGEAVARAISTGPETLLVASTDMSHYVPARVAHELDHAALERVQALDPEGLCELVESRDLSMCGYLPTSIVLAACRARGARGATLVRYGHSGETTGDEEQVVGYAALTIPKP